MERLGLVGELYRDDLLGPNEWWIRDLAAKLKDPPRQGSLLDSPGLDPLSQDTFWQALDRLGGQR